MKIGEYTKIEFEPLDDLNTVLEKLYDFRDRGIKVCTNFHDVMLFSDTVTENGAYVAITGRTKKEFEKETIKEYYELFEENNDLKPVILNMWKTKGGKIIEDKYLDFWNKVVENSIDEEFKGKELGLCLDIIESLNNNEDFQIAKDILKDMKCFLNNKIIFNNIIKAIENCCDKGTEFINFINR